MRMEASFLKNLTKLRPAEPPQPTMEAVPLVAILRLIEKVPIDQLAPTPEHKRTNITPKHPEEAELVAEEVPTHRTEEASASSVKTLPTVVNNRTT